MFNAHRMGRTMLPALVVLVLWIPSSAQAATDVFWSSDVTQPRVGQTVNFFASGDGITYAWNFGDGGNATGESAIHSFSSPGTYTVKVTADGNVAYEQTMTVRGNWGPSNVSMYPQTSGDDNPKVGQSASFSISASDPEDFGALMTYTVNWGDGNTTTITDQTQFSVPINHTYAGPGTYTIRYSATDQDGSVTYPAQTIYGIPFRVRAESNPPPRFPSFFVDTSNPGVGDVLTFTGSATDYDGGSIATYAWDFGDGTTQSGASNTRTHTFSQPGTYPVRMTVTDNGGASATHEDVVYVHPAGNQATGYLYASDFGSYYGSFARTGQSISFNAYTYSLPVGVTTTNYLFKWGDGTANTSTVNTLASHTYASAGDYRPQVDISLSSGQTLHVQYSEYINEDDDLYYSSNFTGSPLRVRANHPPLYGYAYLSNDTGCLHAGQSAAYTLYGYDSDTSTVASFDVDWNSDGTYDQLNIPAISDTASVNHTYATEGIYHITVRVKDGDGATYEDFRDVTQVDVTPDNCLPYASSTHQPDAPQTNKAIQFDGSYSYDLDGTVATYQWDWDGNGTYDSAGISPTHTYATDGDHGYTLKVTDNQGGVGYEHGFVTTHTGNHLPQFLSLYISQNAADTNDTVFFNASGYDDDGKIVTYQWNWGDGTNSQTSSPAMSHVYTTPGTYHPIVTLVDDDGGTASSSPGHTYTITVTAAAPSAQVIWTPEEPHPGNTISFTAYGSSPNGPLNQWTWHWGDGTANTVTSVPNASHAYASAGSYNVTVTVRDTTNATGTGPAQTVGVKTNWAPHAHFAVTPQCATSGTSMTFDGSTTTDSDSVVTSYHWDFGDGTTADTPAPTTTHSYSSDGTYFATLTATDGAATSTPAEREITIQADNCPPQDVLFTYTPSSLPSGSPITFTGLATDPDGTIVSYTWSWGDGTADTFSPTSAGANTNHTFASPGVYFVQVVARDNQGAADKYIERLTVGVDTTAPVVTLTTPADGALAAAKPTYSGAAGNDPSDSGTVTVKVYSGSSVSGGPVQTLNATRTGTTWTITAATALGAGTYTAQAQQSDGAGNTGFSTPHTFTIDPTPPSISLTTPADGASTNDTTPAMSGTAGIAAGDLAGVTVKVYNGTSVLGTLAQTLTTTRNGTTGAYTVDASPALPDGQYTAQATQLDSAGNPGTSTTHTFTVDTTAPVITLTAPADGSSTNDTTPQYAGGGGNLPGDGSTVTVKVYAGATATGAPVHTLTTTRSGTSWAVNGSTPLTDGQYTAQATQLDAAGNSGASNTRTFTVDTTPPAVTLTAPADSARTNDTTPTYSGAAGNATGDSASVTVTIYTGATATGTPVQTLTTARNGGTWTIDGSAPLTAGTYTAQATQTDTAGNTGTSTTKTFVIDTTPPTVTLTAPANGATFVTGAVTFSGAGGTTTGDGASVTVKVYAGPTATGSPVQTLAATRDGTTGAYSVPASSTLPDGQYTAQASQGDSAGNTGTSSANTFTVNGPPVVTVTSPSDGAVLSDTTPAIGGGRGTAAGDLPTVTLKIYTGTTTGGTLVQTLTDAGAGSTWSVTASPALADGTYTIQASQTDSGAATGTSAARTFRIDSTAPAVSVTSPATGSRTNDTTPAITGTGGTATGDANVVTVKLYAGPTASGSPLQTATPAVGGGGGWSFTAAALPEGTYTVQATQTDNASPANTGTSSANTFVVDTTAPVVAVTSPSDSSRTNDTTPDISGTGGTLAGDAGTVTVRVYAGVTATGTALQTATAAVGGGTWSFTAGALAEGTYTIQATQVDSAGNSGASNTRTFTVDTTPPAVTLTAPADSARTNDTTPTYSGAAGNATGDSASVTVTIYTGATATGTPVQTLTTARNGGTWTIDGSAPLTAGTYTAQATQTDTAGNTGTSTTKTFVIDTTPPTVTLTAPANGATVFTGTPSLAGVAGTGAGDGATVTVKVFQGATLVRTLTTTRDAGTGAYSVPASPALPSGSYTAQASQGDSAGNTGTSTINAFEVVGPPVVTLTMPDDGAVLGDDTPDIGGARGTAASDLPTVTLKIYAGTSASGSPVQTLTDGGSGGTWGVTAASLADGTYTALATQSNGSATGTSAARTFRIDTTAPTVTITSPANGSSTTDATPALSGAAGNAAGDGATVTVKLYSGGTVSGSPVRTLTFSRSGASWSATVSPDLALGTYTAQAEQSDSLAHKGTSTAVTFAIVQPVPTNTAPMCTDVSKAVPYGTATAVPLSCTDANGNALTLSVVGSPAHGTLGAISGGSVRYTPDSRYSGPDRFTYKANDGKADSNVATAKVTVGAAPAAEIGKLLKLPPPGIVKVVLAGKKPASANFGHGVCPPACFIVIQLFPNGKSSGKTLGSKQFTVPKGRTVPLKVKLSKSATQKLKKAGKLKCTSVVKTTDAAGQTTTVKLNYTLKMKK